MMPTLRLRGFESASVPPVPGSLQSKVRPRKEPPIFPWLLVIGRINPSQSGTLYDFEYLRPAIGQWLSQDAEPKWGAYLCGMVSASDVPVSFLKEPHAGTIVPGFYVQGIAKMPVEESRPVLHRLASILLAYLQQSVVELHFRGGVDTLWPTSPEPESIAS